MTIVIIVFAVLVIILISKGLVIVKQAEVMIIERLGKYSRTLESGLNILWPVIDKPRNINWRYSRTDMKVNNYVQVKSQSRIDLRETVYDFPRQNVITSDNVSIEINALLYFQVTDPKKATYEINNLPNAIEKLTQTTLRNVIGEMELDKTLTSRDTINSKLRLILDEATDKWGVKVNRVELQDINPPQEIKTAMEKQMRAEREKRAVILTSEGERDAKVNQAEGEKQRVIKESEAAKQQQINEAEGEAKAILAVATATAEGLNKVASALVNEGGSEAMQLRVAQQYIDEFGNLAKAGNTLVIPANLSDIASMISLATTIASDKPPAY